MRRHIDIFVPQIWALVFVLIAGCSTLRPRGDLREEFVQDARFTLEQDGVALFGTKPPSLDELRSVRNPELIRRLVAKLDGPDSVSAETLLSALAVLEGNRLAPDLCNAFDQVSHRLAVDDLNLILMKAAGVGSAIIVIPESGDAIRYKLWLGDTGFGYSQEESGESSSAKPVSDEEFSLAFRKRSQQYWKERL